MFHQPRFPWNKGMSLPKSYLFWEAGHQVFNDVCTKETHVAARPSVLTTSPWGLMLSAGHRAIVGSPGISWTTIKNLGNFSKLRGRNVWGNTNRITVVTICLLEREQKPCFFTASVLEFYKKTWHLWVWLKNRHPSHWLQGFLTLILSKGSRKLDNKIQLRTSKFTIHEVNGTRLEAHVLGHTTG